MYWYYFSLDEVSSTSSQRPSTATSLFSTDGQRSSTSTPMVGISPSTNSMTPISTSNADYSSQTATKPFTTLSADNQRSNSPPSSLSTDGQRSNKTTSNVEISYLTSALPPKSTSNRLESSQTVPKKGTTSYMVTKTTRSSDSKHWKYNLIFSNLILWASTRRQSCT